MSDSHQPIDPARPDLDEGTNVVQAHASVLEDNAAIVRERRVRENGMEPVSLWVIVSSAFVLLVAGAVLNAGGALFNYDEYRVEGYVQRAAPGGGDTGPITMPLIDALAKNGAKTYTMCAGCHGSGGAGDGAQYPPLGGSEWVTGDTETLAMIILNGVTGEISVKGRTWNTAGGMPPQPLQDPVALAYLMTYIRNDLGNSTGDIVTPEMAAAALKTFEERVGGGTPSQVTAAELASNHAKMLPGEAMDPTTVVDIETFEPVDAAPAAE
jgi:mono/diheme cytochrome c family protein